MIRLFTTSNIQHAKHYVNVKTRDNKSPLTTALKKLEMCSLRLFNILNLCLHDLDEIDEYPLAAVDVELQSI